MVITIKSFDIEEELQNYIEKIGDLTYKHLMENLSGPRRSKTYKIPSGGTRFPIGVRTGQLKSSYDIERGDLIVKITRDDHKAPYAFYVRTNKKVPKDYLKDAVEKAIREA